METKYTKAEILAMLREFAASRPGMDPRNYGDWKSYRAESRSVTRDLHDALYLIDRVEMSSMPVETLVGGFRAFSGRLSLTANGLDYCTGQYYPTEFRRAVCAVCAAALWDYYRDDVSAETERRGDVLRTKFRRMYGARMQKRWFD